MKKKILGACALMMICLSSMVLFTACGTSPATKTFSSPTGISITMPASFEEFKTNNTFSLKNTSDEIYFFAQKDTFQKIESLNYDSNMSTAEFAKLIIKQQLLSNNIEVFSASDYSYFSYTIYFEGSYKYYFNVTKKSDNAFWHCVFRCEDEMASFYQNKIMIWASSIVVV